MNTITLTQESIHNEVKEKLKNLKKFEQSEEYTKLKKYCEWETERYEKLIWLALGNRANKTEKHELIYSELDFMLFSKDFLEVLQKKVKDKSFLEELKESLEAIKSHLYLQTAGNFDFCIYSEIDWLKQRYKLYMWIEQTVKQMITKYELQEKDVDVNSTINAYWAKSTQIEV